MDTKMTPCDDDEIMALSCEIIDSLNGFVGDKITPQLIEAVRDVCLSRLREHGIFESEALDSSLEKLARRMQPKFRSDDGKIDIFGSE
jgi:hypothetical protein